MPTKERKLKALCAKKKRVSFVVETPESEGLYPVQNVILYKPEVRKTKTGKYVVIGINKAREMSRDKIAGIQRLPGQKRRKRERQIRQYRVDRIVNGTIE